MTIEEYNAQLGEPGARKVFDDLIKLLSDIAAKDQWTLEESTLIHQVFTSFVPRGNGDRDRLFYLFDRLANR